MSFNKLEVKVLLCFSNKRNLRLNDLDGNSMIHTFVCADLSTELIEKYSSFSKNKYFYYSLYYIPVFLLVKSLQIIMRISGQTK